MTKRTNLVASRHRRNLKEKACLYKGGKCEICGYDKVLGALCFHHKNPSEKEFSFGKRTHSDFDLLKEELDKCMLLCVRCHAEIHDEIHTNNLKSLELELNTQRRPPPGFLTCRSCKCVCVKTHKNQSRCKDCSKPRQQLNIEDIMSLSSTLTVAKIAELKKCSYKTIQRFCDKHGISTIDYVVPTKINWPSKSELTDLVNSKPMIHIAANLGVSDNAVRKHCKKLGIQLPPRGFWLRKT